MEQIRPFVKGDIQQIVDLRLKCFQFSEQPSAAALGDYFEQIFFDSPWYDEQLPSLVYADQRGDLAGFLGVIPRPMTMKESPIRVATLTQFMISPNYRGVASIRLLKEFLSGPQDLSMADLANPATRMLWERLGGSTALLYSMYWSYILRPAAHVQSALRGRRFAARVGAAARPLSDFIDATLARIPKSPFRQSAPPTTEEEATEQRLLECFSEAAGRHALRPQYDERSLRWLLGMVARKKGGGELRKAVVRHADGKMAGWYLYRPTSERVGEVLQIGANQNSVKDVLAHLIHDAWKQGLAVLSGRVQPAFMNDYLQKPGRFRCGGPWTIVHSKRPELMEAIYRGDAFLTRLEGEWWLSF